MITKLHITNFKSHKDTEISLNQLTVLTGINSSGKSSVIQALLLLRQSYLKNRLQDGLDLNKPLVSVGIAEAALYKYAKDPSISFCMKYDGDIIGFDKFLFSIPDNKFRDSFVPLSQYVNQDDDRDLRQLEQVSLFNEHFQYISAQRVGGISTMPKDSYAVNTLHQISSEYGKGELVGNFLFEYGKYNCPHNYINENETISLIEQVTYWERRISPNVTIDVLPTLDYQGFVINYGYDSYDTDLKSMMDLRAENIGYGVSYSLPVIVALLSAQKDDLIIIENPEAHLHPEGQLQLGFLICKVAQYGVQVIVETHSDHIINAVRESCKLFEKNNNNGIPSTNVSVLFFEKDSSFATTVKEISVDGNGMIDYQPKGFFDTFENSFYAITNQL